MSEEALACTTCGSHYLQWVGNEERPNDPMGRILSLYECNKHHITKRVKWGRQSINNLYLRLAKLEKQVNPKVEDPRRE